MPRSLRFSPPLSPRRAAIAALVTAAMLLSACAPAGPRTLTTAESETLASALFRNYDAGVRGFVFAISDGGDDYVIEGYYDFTAHAGVARARTGEAAADRAPVSHLWWTPEVAGELVLEPGDTLADGALLAPDPDDDAWRFAPLEPESSAVAAALALVAGLGSDRPENPQLILQSGAAWLGIERRDGEDLTWFRAPAAEDVSPASPSVPRLLVDERGLVVEVSVGLGGSPALSTLNFDAEGSPATSVPVPPFAPNASPEG